MTALRDRCARLMRGEQGSGVIEFVLLVVVLFVPLTYGVLAFSAVQRTVLAATDAARQAGRAMATAQSAPEANERARYAAELAAQSQNVDAAGMRVWTAPVGATCESTSTRYDAALTNGEVFVVCVQIPIRLPLLPELLSANTATGKYIVAMDSFR